MCRRVKLAWERRVTIGHRSVRDASLARFKDNVIGSPQLGLRKQTCGASIKGDASWELQESGGRRGAEGRDIIRTYLLDHSCTRAAELNRLTHLDHWWLICTQIVNLRENRQNYVKCFLPNAVDGRTGAQSSGLGGRLRAGRVVQLPDVLLQVKVPAEALATRGAGEGLLVVVRVHVEGEVVHLVERLAADGTLELLLAAVRQLVVFVVSCRASEERRDIRIEINSQLWTQRNIINDVVPINLLSHYRNVTMKVTEICEKNSEIGLKTETRSASSVNLMGEKKSHNETWWMWHTRGLKLNNPPGVHRKRWIITSVEGKAGITVITPWGIQGPVETRNNPVNSNLSNNKTAHFILLRKQKLVHKLQRWWWCLIDAAGPSQNWWLMVLRHV